LIFFSSFRFVYAMGKCAPYMGGPFRAELMPHYIMVYLLVVCLWCVCEGVCVCGGGE